MQREMATAAAMNASAAEFHPGPAPVDLVVPEFAPVSVHPAYPAPSEGTDRGPMKLRPEAAEFIPMLGAWAAFPQVPLLRGHLPRPAGALTSDGRLVGGPKQKRQMPFATDEEWEQRISKREKEVETIKALQSYKLYVEVFPPGARGDDEPRTPDPRDRTVSKRMWKWNVEKWRLQLKGRYVYSRAVMLQCREVILKQAKGAAPCSEASLLAPLRTEAVERLVSQPPSRGVLRRPGAPLASESWLAGANKGGAPAEASDKTTPGRSQ